VTLKNLLAALLRFRELRHNIFRPCLEVSLGQLPYSGHMIKIGHGTDAAVAAAWCRSTNANCACGQCTTAYGVRVMKRLCLMGIIIIITIIININIFIILECRGNHN